MQGTRTIEDRLDAVSEPWKPEVGDRLVGTVASVDERTNEWGTYPLIVIETDNGNEITVHGSRTVLRNEFARLRPMVGERIGIKYLGKIDRAGGASYEGYKVVLDRATPPDWDKIALEASADAIRDGIEPADTATATAADTDPVPGTGTDDGIPF
jgi:hypothetical protein